MKTRINWSLYSYFFLILIGCAAAPKNRNVIQREKEYEIALKYSAKLHSEPIDILKEGFELTEISKENQKKEPISKIQMSTEKSGNYSVQIASFKKERNARQYLQDISEKNSNLLFRLHYSGNLWRVVTKNVENRTLAEQLLQRLKINGFLDAWIIQL